MPGMKNRTTVFAVISALFLSVFVVSFFLRGLDDNSLFSWSWAFANVDASRLYLLLAAGLIICSFLSRAPVPDSYHIPFLACISFAVILPLWDEPETIIDASRYFTQAKHLEMYGIGYFLKEWGGTISAWTDLPLVPFLYGLIFKLFGESRLLIQIFTTALFSLTAVLTYLIGERLWNRETGFSAGLLLLGIPYLLTQVPLMLVDVPTMFFLMLAVFAFLKAVDHGGKISIFFSILSIICCVLSKYSAWLMMSVLVVILVVYGFQGSDPERRPRMRRAILILFISAALSVVILFLKSDVVFQQISLLQNYQKPGLGRWGESFLSTFLFQIHPFITLLSLASVVIAVRNRDRKYLIISWLLLLVVLFGIKRIRYILPVFPMLALMAAYGLQAVKQHEIRRFIVYGTVTSSLVIAFFAFLPFANSMSAGNLKRAGAYLNTLRTTEEVEIITLPPRISPANPAVSVPLLDLFTSKRIRYCYRPQTLPDDVDKSSLRFTWLYRNPDYYTGSSDSNCNMPLVVLSEAPAAGSLQGSVANLKSRRLVKEFTASENIFQYSVGVRIYQK